MCVCIKYIYCTYMYILFECIHQFIYWSVPTNIAVLRRILYAIFVLNTFKQLDEAHSFYGSSALLSLLILILISSKNTFTVITRCVWAGVWRLWFSQVDIKLTITPSLIPISSFELMDVTLPSLNHIFVDFFPSPNSRLI